MSGFLTGYYWDTSDWLQNIYSPGVQGFLQYEFVQMSSSMHIAPDVLDIDYLTPGGDIENFLPIPALPLNTDMSAVPEYDQHTRSEVHHVNHPTARPNSMLTSSQHPSHCYLRPIETTSEIPQGQHIGPAEITDFSESHL